MIRGSALRPKKRLGQHFLKRKSDARKIVTALSLTENDTVLEIGPGLGILSELLVETARNVIAVEIDAELSALLADRFDSNSNFHLICEDVLHINLEKLRKEYNATRLKIIGNLPYAVTTPILFFLLQHKPDIESIVVTLQREVAQRILATPTGKEYGALTIAIQYHSVPERVFDLPASAFYPEPKVDSTVLRLRILDRPSVLVQDEALFFRTVRSAFQQRRKMLRNALSATFALSTDDLKNISDHSGIDLRRRGETLSLAEFGRLSDTLLVLKSQ